ncbi:MAG: choice-of-anchor I family protein [Coleofasciculus chthonoplastes F3-SA18-01]|uniref:choice-of-anchor I family protein n=1 Tax=Coleofasciculus chthonoplastes TaxID=64178 RepID=UPI0032FCD0AC
MSRRQNSLIHRIPSIVQSTLQSAVLLGIMATPAAAINLNLKPIGSFSTGIFANNTAEQTAYDPITQRLFVTSSGQKQINILDISNPMEPSEFTSINLASYGSPNSVSYNNGRFAVSVTNEMPQNSGLVLFFDSEGNSIHDPVSVGSVPDSLTFTPDGTKIIVANEGELSDDYPDTDPVGSVSIIDLTTFNVTTASFNNVSLPSNVRLFGPNADNPAQNLEPEFVTVSQDSQKAYVTLQENNAIAVVDIASGQVEKVIGLGFKDYSLPGNALDASNKDGGINIANYDNLFGMFQPDGITSYIVDGQTYLVTANEGDSRDFDFFSEEARVGDLLLDPQAFPNAAELQKDENLGRLKVTNTLGDTDDDGDFDELYTFGGRSFSIWDTDGTLIFDSGDAFEQITAEFLPEFFNSNDELNLFDDRSDDKGPEPQAVTIAELFGRTIAFIGLERMGGIISYDITDPFNPFFLDYVNNRDFSVEFNLNEEGAPDPTAEQLAAVGDLGLEGLLFIAANESPNGKPLVVTANETSGTLSVFAVESVPEPSSVLGLLMFSSLGWVGLKRRCSTKFSRWDNLNQ